MTRWAVGWGWAKERSEGAVQAEIDAGAEACVSTVEIAETRLLNAENRRSRRG